MLALRKHKAFHRFTTGLQPISSQAEGFPELQEEHNIEQAGPIILTRLGAMRSLSMEFNCYYFVTIHRALPPLSKQFAEAHPNIAVEFPDLRTGCTQQPRSEKRTASTGRGGG